MLAFKSYIKPSNKKYNIDLKSVDEDVPRKESYKLANPHVSFDNDPTVSTIPIAKEQTIDPYEPKEQDVFKAKPLSYKAFDDLLIGFSPDAVKTPALADNDTKAMFGVVSPSELMLSNLETENGVPNRLNTLLKQKDTGMSIDQIKTEDAQLGKAYDNLEKNGLDSFMKEYNALSPTTDVDELKMREQGKKKTVKAIKDMTEEQRKQAMIRSRKFMPKKTVIQPVVPPTPKEKPKVISDRKKGEPPLRLQEQEPVKGFKESKKKILDVSTESPPAPKKSRTESVKSIIKKFINPNDTPAPKPKAVEKTSTPKPRSLGDIFTDIADRAGGKKFIPIAEEGGDKEEKSVPPPLPPIENMQKLNLKDLRELAKSYKIDKYYHLNKPELLIRLNSTRRKSLSRPPSPVDQSQPK